jgi:hypothetical protein
MTDVPHACLVLVTLWFILQKRWIPAAVFAAFAEGMRLEAWVFVIVLPLLQFACERRLSWRVLMIVLVSPLAWLAISFAATGDAFAYFAKRAVYQAGYFDFYPSRRGFVLADIWQDVNYFLLGANALAVLAIIAAGGLSIFAAFRRSQRLCWPVAAIATCAVAFFAFLLAAYATKRQPVILPRYGMIFFILGLPLLAWLLHLLISNWPGSRAPKFIAALLIAVCLWISWPQVATISKVLDDFRAHRQIAQQLALALHQSPDQAWRCFSDDAAVRVLSRLPAQRFLRSETARAEARANAESFKSYLQKNHVVWLVFVRIENSLPAKFLPDLGRSDKIDLGDFQLASVAFSPFGSDVWLYRVRKFD